MATTLIIEDGTQVADANTYVTLDEVMAYWSLKGGTSPFASQSDCGIEAALIKAGSYLNLNYRGRFTGRKLSKEQGLHFPVAYGTYGDGYTIDQDEIPQELKDAQSELAAIALTDSLFNDNSSGTSAVTKTMNKVGPIEKEITYTSAGTLNRKSYPQVDTILCNILVSAGVLPAIRV